MHVLGYFTAWELIHLLSCMQIFIGFFLAVVGTWCALWNSAVEYPADCSTKVKRVVFIFGYVSTWYLGIMLVFGIGNLLVLAGLHILMALNPP